MSNLMELETVHLHLMLQSTEEVLAQIEAMSPTDQTEVSQTGSHSSGLPHPRTRGRIALRSCSKRVVPSLAVVGTKVRPVLIASLKSPTE